ncbi:hydrolase, TatD family [Desulfocapsa sulfexigens DSM 10523]|uniref:Hydrolase, TatD family n=1 Tax=Desulfocapsa sulfexigens (strain DSM 10523 / SB164P1) TaxID=1167006 RepID=M1PBS1_DESSD|nr:TatD family hydrolase [Desulfocapsa sulfexigens]AGF77215.1 hydrolase, TatD family [Desulfocapsa sulfexigens DSM 10523]
MELIDTHSHIDLPIFKNDFREVLHRARMAGVVAQVLPGVTRSGWNRILQLSDEEQDLFPAIGLHPMYLSDHGRDDLQLLQQRASAGDLVAIGEIGLDYFVKDCNRSAQQELFEAQLAIASKAALPVLLHVRKAHDQVQATLRRLHFTEGGIVHAFSGSLQQAEHYIKLGFLVSICGTITYDRATRIRSVAAALPLNSLVLETDSPDIPPASHHGERNSPEYLTEVALSLARLRDVPVSHIAEKTSNTVRALLSL